MDTKEFERQLGPALDKFKSRIDVIPKAFNKMKSSISGFDSRMIDKLSKGGRGLVPKLGAYGETIHAAPNRHDLSGVTHSAFTSVGTTGGGRSGPPGRGAVGGLLDPLGWSDQTKQVVGFGAAMHALTSRGSELNEMLTKISILTEESTDNYGKFSTLAITSMGDVKASMSEVNEAYTVLAKNQITGERQLLKYANTALKLTNITGLTATRTATLAVTYDKITRGRGNFEAFASTFARLHSTTRATAEELAGLVDKAEELSLFVGRIGPRFTESILSAGAAMKDLFGDPTPLLDAFQEAQQLTDRGMRIQSALARVGVDFNAVSGNVEDFTLALTKAVQSIPKDQLQKLGDMYADVFGVDKVTLLRLHNAELSEMANKFAETRKAASDSEELNKRWSDSMSSFSEQFSNFRNQLWNLVRQFGAPMMSALTPILQFVNWLLKGLNWVIERLPGALKGFIGFAVLGGLLAKTLTAAFGGVSAALLALRGGLGLLGLDIAKTSGFIWKMLAWVAGGVKTVAVSVGTKLWAGLAAKAPAVAGALSGVGAKLVALAPAAGLFAAKAAVVYAAMALVGGASKVVGWSIKKLAGVFDEKTWPRTHKTIMGIGTAFSVVGERLIKPWKLIGDVKRLFSWLSSDGEKGAEKTAKAFSKVAVYASGLGAIGGALKLAGKGMEWVKGFVDPNSSPRLYKALNAIEQSFKKSGEYISDPAGALSKLWAAAKSALGVKDKAPPPPQSKVGRYGMSEQAARSRILSTQQGSWAPGKALLEGLKKGDSERDLMMRWMKLAEREKDFVDYLTLNNPGRSLGHLLRDEFYREYEKMQQAVHTAPNLAEGGIVPRTTGGALVKVSERESEVVGSLRVLKELQADASLLGAHAVVQGLTPLLRVMVELLQRQEGRFSSGRSPVVDVDENLIRMGIL